MKTLRDILIATLNATLILMIALVVCLIMLVGRVSALRDTTVAAVSAQTDRIVQLSQSVQRLDDKLAQCAPSDLAGIKTELAALRAKAPDLSGLKGMTVRDLAEQIVSVAGERLNGIRP